LRHDVRAIRLAIVTLAVIACLTIGVAAGDLLAPTAIAIVLTLVLAPVASLLERAKVPPSFAAVVVVGTTISVIVSSVVTFAPSASYWMERAPAMVRSIEHKLEPIKNALSTLQNQIENTTQPAGKPAQTTVAPAAPAAPAVDSTRIVASLALFAPGALAQLFYVTMMTIFLLAFRSGYSEQLVLLPRHYQQRLKMARIIRDVRLRVSGYVFTLATINVCLVPVVALALTIAASLAPSSGISDPLLWGIAYGLLNFIPIIGPTTCIVAATAVGMASAETIPGALLLPGILLGIHALESNLVQPWLVARRLVVSPIAVFAMVAILVWMWGVFAAITAVPILILLHTVMMHVPSMRPFATLLATEHSTHPHHVQYMRNQHQHHAWLRKKNAETRKARRKKVSPAAAAPPPAPSGLAPDTARNSQ